MDTQKFDLTNKWTFGFAFSKPYNTSLVTFQLEERYRPSPNLIIRKGFPWSLCNQTLFPLQNQTIYKNLNIDYYVCPVFNTNELWGDKFGKEFKEYNLYFLLCSGSSTCGTSYEIANYVDGLTAYLVILNTYYDESDNANPIKQYVHYTKQIDLTDWMVKSEFITIQPTQITFLNGSTTYAFEVDNIQSSQLINFSNTLCLVSFYLGTKRNKIIEYTMNQPNTTSRMLESSMIDINSSQFHANFVEANATEVNSEIEENSFYKTFNILTKIGGFCFLLNFVFGSVCRIINEFVMKVEIIKRIKSELKSNYQRRINSDNPPVSRRQVAPIQNEETKDNAPDLERNDQNESQYNNLHYSSSIKDVLFYILFLFGCRKINRYGREAGQNKKYMCFEQELIDFTNEADMVYILASINKFNSFMNNRTSVVTMNTEGTNVATPHHNKKNPINMNEASIYTVNNLNSIKDRSDTNKGSLNTKKKNKVIVIKSKGKTNKNLYTNVQCNSSSASSESTGKLIKEDRKSTKRKRRSIDEAWDVESREDQDQRNSDHLNTSYPMNND